MINGRHLIGGGWVGGDGSPFASTDPATGDSVWQGRAATQGEIDRAVAAARDAFERWAELEPAQRQAYLERFAEKLNASKLQL